MTSSICHFRTLAEDKPKRVRVSLGAQGSCPVGCDFKWLGWAARSILMPKAERQITDLQNTLKYLDFVASDMYLDFSKICSPHCFVSLFPTSLVERLRGRCSLYVCIIGTSNPCDGGPGSCKCPGELLNPKGGCQVSKID